MSYRDHWLAFEESVADCSTRVGSRADLPCVQWRKPHTNLPPTIADAEHMCVTNPIPNPIPPPPEPRTTSRLPNKASPRSRTHDPLGRLS